MITARSFRSFALGLPHTEEAPHFDRASFRVGGKIFATLTRSGDQAMVRVADVERVQALLEDPSGAFFSHGGWTVRNGALGVHLAKVDATLVRSLLSDAWKHIVPKSLLASEAKPRAKKGRRTPSRT